MNVEGGDVQDVDVPACQTIDCHAKKRMVQSIECVGARIGPRTCGARGQGRDLVATDYRYNDHPHNHPNDHNDHHHYNDHHNNNPIHHHNNNYDDKHDRTTTLPIPAP